MTSPVVEVNNVNKVYGGRAEASYQALDNVSFSIQEGEFVGVMGASGSGKTTLLQAIAALDRVSSGQITIAGTNVTDMKEKELTDFRARRLGFIFQDFNLLENMTVYENIALPLFLQNQKGKSVRESVYRAAEMLGMEDTLSKYPAMISGGQKQRAAAARALVHHPSMILADEPTGALDSGNAKGLLETLQHLNETYDVTTMMVTHDAFSASYCERILFLEDGRLYKEMQRTGSREEFFKQILDEQAEAGKNKL
ncbi:ABC transporter ATP-binding protein [Salibacterium qingdaonense]|uniref:Putative ABC transport system ATP-binding protein n=1 Tax=Salibacterium qingdaonense TaxID=266892 RepID=A0A1I4HUY7_9BACI|nr:ABC transporter ATP-binding protein [Salibacterium qingdaonense]SFL45563.1 putative ABC transport system ATP-binding protein [Salibacterium qingdaonense]